jgi:hypothetical protein
MGFDGVTDAEIFPSGMNGLGGPLRALLSAPQSGPKARVQCFPLGRGVGMQGCKPSAAWTPCPVKGRRLSSNHIGLPQRENSETFRCSAYSLRDIENNRFSRRSFLRAVADLDDRVVPGNRTTEFPAESEAKSPNKPNAKSQKSRRATSGRGARRPVSRMRRRQSAV